MIMLESEYLTQWKTIEFILSLQADVMPLVDILREGHVLPWLANIRNHSAGSLGLNRLRVVEAGVGQ